MLQRYGPMVFRPYPEDGGTNVVLCGAEIKIFRRQMIAFGVRSCLISYYYLRNILAEKKDKIEVIIEDLKHFDLVYIDSGGYTLQLAVDSGKLNISIPEYIEEYYSFAEKLRASVTVFGAVDCISVQHGFSREAVDRAVFEGRERGIHIAPTVFADESLESVKQSGYLQHFDYIGLSSGGIRKVDIRSRAISMFMYLKRRRMRVHGYAMTSLDDFRYFQFYSVDSATWLGGMRFGSTYLFQHGRMRTFNLKYKERIRPQLYNLCKETDLDYDAIMSDNWREINRLNLLAWHRLAEHHRQNTRRAYWKHTRRIYVMDNGSDVPRTLEDQMSDLLRLSDSPGTEEDGGEDNAEEIVNAEEDFLPDLGPSRDVVISEAAGLTIPMKCDSCYIADKCPKFSAGADCSIQFSQVFQLTARGEAIKESAYRVLELQYERVMRGALFERMSEGVIDTNLSYEVTRYFNILRDIKALHADESSIKITANGQAASNLSSGGGILSGLFADPAPDSSPDMPEKSVSEDSV